MDTVEDCNDTVNEPPPPPLSRYTQKIISMPLRQDGLESMCNLINSKIEELCAKHSPRPSTSSIASVLEGLTQEQFGPYGKVGMFIRKETVDALEKALLDDEVQVDQGEVLKEGLEAVDPAGFELDEVLTEKVEVTLEGLDKDFLLEVDSQAALDKLTKIVSKTIEENHPVGENRVVVTTDAEDLITTPTTGFSAPATVPPKNTTPHTEPLQPVPDNSDAHANPNNPFKFAFLPLLPTMTRNAAFH